MKKQLTFQRLEASQQAHRQRKDFAMLKLNVPDMTCGHCASTVEKAVKSVDPAAKVNVDLGSKTVTVDSVADETKVKDVIRSAGYENEKMAA